MFSLRRALPFLALCMAVSSVAARAATFNVSVGDVSALKNALNAANSNGQNDVINLAANSVYTLSAVDNDPGGDSFEGGGTGLPVIGADGGKTLLINGNGATIARADATDVPLFRLLKVEAGGSLTLDSLTLRGGRSSDYAAGGAILNAGNLTLQKCSVTGNLGRGGAVAGLGASNVISARDSVFENNQSSLSGSGGALSASDSVLNVTGCTFIGNSSNEGGAIGNQGASSVISVSASAFSRNRALGGGAIAMREGDQLSVSSCTFTRNSASFGGAIYVTATTRVQSSTFSGNSAFYNGGALQTGGSLTIENSLIDHNSAGAGGGIEVSGSLNLSNSTLSGNTATGDRNQGGGGAVRGGALTLNSCTITANRAPNDDYGRGGLALPVGASPTIRNSIVTGNNADGDKQPAVISGDHNILSGDAKIDTLKDNGGPTRTHALMPGSPALDAGATALTRDQRGVTRPQGGADDIGAFESQGAAVETPSLIVTTLDDATKNDGLNSLREAMDYASVKSGADTISFAPGVRGVIVLRLGELPIVRDALILDGPGAGALAIDGAGQSRILDVQGAPSAIVSGLTLQNGDAANYRTGGGAIYNAGQLTVTQCVLANNNASFFEGGAIYNDATLTLKQSTVKNNSARSSAVYSASTLAVDSSTISDNTSGGLHVVGIYYSGATLVQNSTVSGNADYGLLAEGDRKVTRVQSSTFTGNGAAAPAPNEAPNSRGGLIAYVSSSFGSSPPRVEVSNTLVAGNSGNDVAYSSYDPVSSPIVSQGHNLIGSGNAASAFSASSDVTGVSDAKLGPLRDNGGPTYTHALLAGSPALDVGATSLDVDQRGFVRPQGSADDIGAYEAGTVTTETPSLIVTTLQDVSANDGQTSLREAIGYANSKASTDTISFADNVRGTLKLGGTPLPVLSGDATIRGPGAGALFIDGAGKSRLLEVARGYVVTVSGLTLRGGQTDDLGGAMLNKGTLTLDQVVGTSNSAREGGAIYNAGGVLSVRASTLSGNSAGEGGAITNNGGALSIENSTLSGNTSGSSAGAISNNGGTSTLTNSTLSGNVALGGSELYNGGGAIDSFGGNARVSLNFCTVSANSAPNVAAQTRAGIWVEGGILAAANSILGGNGAQDIEIDGGTFNSGGYNLIGSAGTASATSTDLTGANANLGPLDDNGGPTQTRALLAGSAAIDAADPNFRIGNDQRGIARPQGRAADIGAFEADASAQPPFRANISPLKPATNDTLSAAPYGTQYRYVWKRNGVVIPGETSETLDLSQPGNGDKGDVISVEISDGALTSTARVTVQNSAPVAFSESARARAGVEAAFILRGADIDAETLTFRRVGGPTNGTAEIRVDPSDGKLKLFYTGRARFGGTDAIRFVAVDGDGRTSNIATLSINVLYDAPPPVNRAPFAQDGSIDTFVGKSEVKLLLGSDPDGDPLAFRLVNGARYGFSEIRRDTDGKFKLFYTSLNKFYGADSVKFVAVDTKGRTSNVATIAINFINRAPTASNASVTVAAGGATSQLLFGDDPDGNEITFRQVNGARAGTSEIKRDEQGRWRVYYQSRAGYSGADAVTFVTVDSFGRTSNVATVSINVVAVGAAASASGSSGGSS